MSDAGVVRVNGGKLTTYREMAADTVDVVVRQLGSQRHWFGDEFTAVDAYLFTILRWAEFTNIPLPAPLSAFVERVATT